MCPSFFHDAGGIAPVSDDQIFTIISVSLGLTVIWVFTSMVFGPFYLGLNLTELSDVDDQNDGFANWLSTFFPISVYSLSNK